MKYLKIWDGNGYCGCDFEDIILVDNDMTEDEAYECARDEACDNAESFAYVHFGWDESYTDEEYEEYIENNVECNFEFVTRAEYLKFCENYGYEPQEETN